MIIDVVTVGPSSSYSKVCIVEDQRNVVSVVEKRIELFLHPSLGSKEMGSTAMITIDFDVIIIIQFRRTLWKKMWFKKSLTQKI